MHELQLTPEDLLAGATMTFDVVVPGNVWRPGENSKVKENEQERILQLRPLTIGAFQLIMKAAKNDLGLIPLLMIKESLVQPALSLDQIKQLHLGFIDFLIGHIRKISGLTEKKKPINDWGDSQLVQAGYLFARAFGWTPRQLQEITVAQVSIYLQMLEEETRKSRNER
jgi:hypothetical protein